MSDAIKDALFAALCEAGLKVPEGEFGVHATHWETSNAKHPDVLQQTFIVSVSEILPEPKK